MLKSDPRPSIEGFALVEVLVSLTIVAIALLLVIQLLVLDARTIRRRSAQREVLEVMEGTVEILRAGRLPPESMTFEAAELGLLLDRPVRPMTVELGITPHPDVANLWDVSVEAEYRAGTESQSRTLETRIWRPL